jgi:hypothetical protein
MGMTPTLLRVLARVQHVRKNAVTDSVLRRWQPAWLTFEGFPDFALHQLRVVNQDKVLVPFALNRMQRTIYETELRLRREGKRPWILVLKYRKGGVTTLEQAQAYHEISRHKHAECLTFAHRDEDTRMIFRMVDRYYDEQPEDYRHRKTQANVGHIEFPDMDSIYMARTAGGDGSGRGSTLSRVHMAEAAHYVDLAGLHTGLAKSVGTSSAYILETTPNGRDGKGQAFFEFWRNAREGRDPLNPFVPLFFPWHFEPSHAIALRAPDEIDHLIDGEVEELMARHRLTKEQVKWWLTERAMIVADGKASAKIHQEHPSDEDSCFLYGSEGYYDLDQIKRAEARCEEPLAIEDNGRLTIFEVPDPDGLAGDDYIIGGDPSGGRGKDACGALGFNLRTGRQAFTYEYNRIPEDDFGIKLAELGRRWTNPKTGRPAFIIYEDNNHGHGTGATLRREAAYPPDRIYHYENAAKAERDPHGRPIYETGTPGWPTNAKTKALMAAAIGQMLREQEPRILDKNVLASIQGVPDTPTGPDFNSKDTAVAAGLCLVGWAQASAGMGSDWAFVGGRVVNLATGQGLEEPGRPGWDELRARVRRINATGQVVDAEGAAQGAGEEEGT